MARPRKFSVDATVADRQAASRAALKAAGGAPKTFRLGAEAINALAAVMGVPDAPKTESQAVEQALIAYAQQRQDGR